METIPKLTCPQHPFQHLESICFHPQCKRKLQQLICPHCISSEGEHSTHHQYIEPLHRITEAFELITSSDTQVLQDLLLTKMNQANEYLSNIKDSIIGGFNIWKQKQISKLKCLSSFLNCSSLQTIFKNIRNQEQHHTPCCMHLINFLYDNTKSYGLCSDRTINALSSQISDNYRSVLIKANNLRQIVQEMIDSKDYDQLCIADLEVKLELQAKTSLMDQTIKEGLRGILNKDSSKRLNGDFYQTNKDTHQQEKSLEPSFSDHNTFERTSQSYLEQAFQSFNKKIPGIIPLEQQESIPTGQTFNKEVGYAVIGRNYKVKSHTIRKTTVRTRRSYGKKELPIEIEQNQAQNQQFSQKTARKQLTTEKSQRKSENNEENLRFSLVQMLCLGKQSEDKGDKKMGQVTQRRSQRLKRIQKTNYLECQSLFLEQECPKSRVQTSPSQKIYKKGQTLVNLTGEIASSLKKSRKQSSKHRPH